jgi:hypothetical protein
MGDWVAIRRTNDTKGHCCLQREKTGSPKQTNQIISIIHGCQLFLSKDADVEGLSAILELSCVSAIVSTLLLTKSIADIRGAFLLMVTEYFLLRSEFLLFRLYYQQQFLKVFRRRVSNRLELICKILQIT